MRECINWDSLERQIKNFGNKPPFDHVVIDDFFTNPTADALVSEFPEFESNKWFDYDNAIEIKRVCNNWNYFPENTYSVFTYLNSVEFTDYLSGKLLNGIKLYSDAGLHGGGWHAHKSGGKLNTHLDYSLHPKLHLQRKLNIIVYLNPLWREEWGGSLGLWGNESCEHPGELVSTVWSKFNRAIIFDTTQNSWHGLPNPIKCPKHQARQSLAVYYLCQPDETTDSRGKALFAPTEAQRDDEDVLDLIQKRADVNTASKVWKQRT